MGKFKERVDWELEKENSIKKNIARSAKNKVTHTGCTLPSDYLTASEKNKLNGEVQVMNIYKPMTYRYFKTLPNDVAAEYIEWLAKTFHAGLSDIAAMLNTTERAIRCYLSRRDIKINIMQYNGIGKATKPVDKQAWDRFCSGLYHNAPESDENDRSETFDISKDTEPVSENAPESDEKPRYDFDKVMAEVSVGFITMNDAMDILGLPHVADGDEKGINVPKEMTKEEWLNELSKSVNEFAERQKKIIEEKHEARVSELQNQINQLTSELKLKLHSGRYPWNDINNTTVEVRRFTVKINNLKNWNDLATMMKSSFNLPDNNSITIIVNG